MDKMVVIVFDDESKAYEGTQALKALHKEGSLSVYQAAIISKDSQGKVTVRDSTDQGPLGTVLGWATGGLIGLLGGPVGFAIGAMSGTIAGSVYDLSRLGVGGDFLEEVKEYLLPNKSAIVAEVEENWVTPLDTRAEALGGRVFRRPRVEFENAQWEKEVAADKAELKDLKDEYNKEVGEAKEKIKTKLDSANKKFEAKREAIKERISENNREFEAKLGSLQEQLKTAKDDKRAALEKRITDLKADQEMRAKKLNEAWQLAKEALA